MNTLFVMNNRPKLNSYLHQIGLHIWGGNHRPLTTKINQVGDVINFDTPMNFCPLKTSKCLTISLQMEKEDTTKGGLLSCQYCLASVINMNEWRDHVNAKHLDLIKTSPGSGEEWGCTLCSMQIPSSSHKAIRWHVKSHLNITCSLCGRVFQQEKKRSPRQCFKEHKRYCREDKKPNAFIMTQDGKMQCPRCFKAYTAKSSFYYHITKAKCNPSHQKETTCIQKKTMEIAAIEILGTLEPIKPESV